MREVKIMSKRGELLFKICPQCGKEFSCMPSREKTYCCKECANKAKTHGDNIQCDNCGKIFYRIQAHIDRQKRRGQNSFCCLKCQKEYLHKQLFEIRACEICGREFEVSKTSKQRFCSDACQIQWQTMQVGELNPRFTSILTPCTYCGREHYVKPYKFNQQDNFFCSTECRQAWYAEVYSQRDEWKEMSRQRILTQFQNGNLDTETIPQKIVNSMLDEIGIRYDREKQFEYYAVDNYLLDYDLIIEIQGDYWHANPLKFTEKLTKQQCDRIRRDKSKHSYFKNQYNIEILYLWEYDILKRPDICIELIKTYVSLCGTLNNYHSFNYSIEDSQLLLNNNLITPYQDVSMEQCKQLLVV